MSLVFCCPHCVCFISHYMCRWRPERVSLVGGSSRGSATQATEIIKDSDGKLAFRYVFARIYNNYTHQSDCSHNPGRIDPSSPAWEETRKPLAAAWQTTTNERFYTVNVHFSSKRGSSPSHGNARPPVNGHSERRTHQVNVTAVSPSSDNVRIRITLTDWY